MRIINLSTQGITPVRLHVVSGKGDLFMLAHGEQGRGRWQIQWPVVRAPGLPHPGSDLEPVLEGEFDLKSTPHTDKQGNPVFLVTPGRDDGQFLVLWHLEPGYRGGATWQVGGEAQVLARGYEAQGAAGRMGGADCPVVLVHGPAELHWQRSGRLYGHDPDWIARYDGQEWSVSTAALCGAEDLARTWQEEK